MPLPAVQRHKFGRTDANTRAPVGADDSVRPAERTHEHGRTLANPYHICRGRCRALPARCTFVFMIRCGKFAIAPRADRGVRPYRVFAYSPMVRADLRLQFAGSMWASTPTDTLRLRHPLYKFCQCTLRGRGKPRPYITTKNAPPAVRGCVFYSPSSRTGLFLLYATTMRRLGSVPVENVVTSG